VRFPSLECDRLQHEEKKKRALAAVEEQRLKDHERLAAGRRLQRSEKMRTQVPPLGSTRTPRPVASSIDERQRSHHAW
jgi:hypothetical protein